MTSHPFSNPRGMLTLFWKEVWRFLKVTVQTLLTPIVLSLLYLLVFKQVLEEHVEVYSGIGYTAFLIPGLVMMAVIQNAFANTSSSLIQAKVNGSLVFVLLAPLSSVEFYLAYVGAAMLRGLLVGAGVYLAALGFTDLPLAHIGGMIVFALLASLVLGALGMLTAILADTYEQLSALQNFIIVPLSFLSGVFYSIHDLPPLWHAVSRLNPFFYMIDGFRYSVLGVSDVAPALSLGITLGFAALLSAACLFLLKKGYKIRA
ncbi:MAG: ABC transporter permease [Gammaproteobacteria bacterium]|nr:ABC transporter permease [Gammaproteobacteria bacterium]